ncbi:GTP 3',8-cyclase MoaA [Corynebacterium sp. MSK218]|uniref:GTP 3',8-cyclase MoaA n=1 Tax=Corynebacterium sp. MSK218 TaxID=3050218 RepID=UPI002551C90A|nr:GTP 3',8-cyclase MoaA [Corynebacterium sp. MSK218]MDK8763864.1 GTP 3',8-cyclase MoaA [Corynebacterium sp. MSK218]
MSDRVFLPTPSPRGIPRGGANARPPDLPPALNDGRRDLLDRYGRQARDLRVSLTDRCNLRCTYCMPAEGLEWMATEQTLSDDETIRLIRIAVTQLGIRQVRFTGGEPLLRKSLEKIIAATTQLRTDEKLAPATALTTNGLGLPRRLDGLIEAGLDRVNISLDTIDPELYARLTRRDRLGDVFAAIEAATAAHREGRLGTVKVNAVVMPGVNEEDIVPLARYCLERGAQLRFIEQMPLGPRDQWDREQMVTADDILARLAEVFELQPASEQRGSAPAALWEATGLDADTPSGRIGVIASVTHPFCGSCDRTRLTTDGAVRNCLFGNSETSLRDLMRSGASDSELAHAWAKEMWAKLPGHGVNDEGFLQPDRPMSAIGG